MQATRLSIGPTCYLKLAGLAALAWRVICNVASLICKTKKLGTLYTLIVWARCVSVKIRGSGDISSARTVALEAGWWK
jgi:hypothetical protein